MYFNAQTTALLVGLSKADMTSVTNIETSKIALRRMINRAKELGYTTFLCGLKLGVEQWGAAMIIDDSNLTLVACPENNQEQFWQWTQQRMYEKLLQHASQVLLVNEDIYHWMCDRSTLVLAVWDGRDNQIQSCLAYAKAFGLSGMVFNPQGVTYDAL